MESKYGEGIAYALENIIWYNCHYVWLKELRDALEKLPKGEHMGRIFGPDEWHTEHHMIWMLLVGMFGNWGTSIRSGWIDKIPECIEFIDEICKESWEAEVRDG